MDLKTSTGCLDLNIHYFLRHLVEDVGPTDALQDGEWICEEEFSSVTAGQAAFGPVRCLDSAPRANLGFPMRKASWIQGVKFMSAARVQCDMADGGGKAPLSTVDRRRRCWSLQFCTFTVQSTDLLCILPFKPTVR